MNLTEQSMPDFYLKKDDGRKLDAQELKERRKQVIQAHKQGLNKKQISRDIGLSYPAVRNIILRYQEQGDESLTPCRKGRRYGENRALTEAQEAHIRRIICEQSPEQLKIEFALWNRGAVQQLIEQECEIKLRVRAIGNYLKRWGFTPPKPIKRTYQLRPEAVKQWLDNEYPAIEKRARTESGEIQWGEETAVVNIDVRGRSFAPQGKTPVITTVDSMRHKLSMISTVTNRGKARWMVIGDTFNPDKLIEFLEALIKNSNKKVFLILDNLLNHRNKPVKKWLADNRGRIEVFYLPAHSAELNPAERLDADLKRKLNSHVSHARKPS